MLHALTEAYDSHNGYFEKVLGPLVRLGSFEGPVVLFFWWDIFSIHVDIYCTYRYIVKFISNNNTAPCAMKKDLFQFLWCILKLQNPPPQFGTELNEEL